MGLLVALPVLAQNDRRPRFNPEEFKAKLEAYVAQHACLTQDECEKVFPIYHEMKEKKRELQKQEHKLKSSTSKTDASEKEYQDALNRIAQLHIESAKIENQYYKKMCKEIPAKKVYGILLAEDVFHREMLNRFNQGQNKQKHKP